MLTVGGAVAAAGAGPRTRAVAPDVPRPALSARDAKLDARLRGLITPEASTALPPPTLVPADAPWQRGDAVRVHLRLAAGGALGDLVRRGLTLERTAGDAVEGWVRTADLPALAEVDSVRSIEPARPGRLRTTADVASRADLARAAGFDGSGVTVGVISDGVGSPPRVAVPPGCDAGSGSEGQAIADVVHTLAPGAQVLFASGIASALGFVDAVHCLQAAGAQVIVDDLGFFDQPFFEDGSIAQAVRAAVQAGVSYHSAAGNEAMAHYSAPFRATAGSSHHDFAPGGTADSYDEIDLAPGEELDCVLQWDDPFGAAADDYDLEVYDMASSPPRLVRSSTNPQTGSQNPYEDFGVINRGQSTGRAGVAITKVHGGDRVLDLFCFGGSDPEYQTPAGSVIGHPAVAEVVAVGAMDVHVPGLATVESYSSQGPVELFFPTHETRAKPDLVAFDGVTTSVPGFGSFYGTSAAAPDTAAVAALMLDKNGCRTPAQIQSALASSAVDIGAPGTDPVAGAGRLDALAALAAVPPPTCTADTECDDGNACTTDVCEGCSCEHRSACDDGDSCTVDTCDPEAGCTNTTIEGFAGVACVCQQSLDAAACGKAPVSRTVGAQFAHACRLVARAAHASNPARARRLVGRGLAVLEHAHRRVAVAVRRGVVVDACSAALETVIDDARGRTGRLRESL